MAAFEEYASKYQSVRMERRDGILQITLHTNGDSLQWGGIPHEELPQVFHDIGTDPQNRVVIMTALPATGTRPTGRASTF